MKVISDITKYMYQLPHVALLLESFVQFFHTFVLFLLCILKFPHYSCYTGALLKIMVIYWRIELLIIAKLESSWSDTVDFQSVYLTSFLWWFEHLSSLPSFNYFPVLTCT